MHHASRGESQPRGLREQCCSVSDAAAALEDWAEYRHVVLGADRYDDLHALMGHIDDADPQDGLDSVFARRMGDGSTRYTRLGNIRSDPTGAWRHQPVGPTFSELYRYHTGSPNLVVGGHRSHEVLPEDGGVTDEAAAEDRHDEEDDEEEDAEDDDEDPDEGGDSQVAAADAIADEADASSRSKRRRT